MSIYYILLYLVCGALLSVASYLLGGKQAFLTFTALLLLSFIPFGIYLPFAPVHAGIFTLRWKLSLGFLSTLAVLIGGNKPMKQGAGMNLILNGIMSVPVLMAMLVL